MEKATFVQFLETHQDEISAIRRSAHEVHAAVNQHYDRTLPYSVHLDSVANIVMEYAHTVCTSCDDILPIIFGAYFHDSIEDARLTYNNVMSMARRILTDEQALMATEIVYALTNEKGRSRAERANSRYYEGIRTTPYAPICKMADRIANASYSAAHSEGTNQAMRHVYAQENAHFLASVAGDTSESDPRMSVPQTMISALQNILK